MEQATNQRGRVSTQVRYGPVQLVLAVPEGEVLFAWASEAQKRQPAQVHFCDADGGGAVETLSLTAAYCVRYHEQFVHGDARGGAYQAVVTLSDPEGWTLTAGGPAAAFVAPAAREHGVPQVAVAVDALRSRAIGGGPGTQVAAPFVAGADGVPRLPRITGDPPFTVKGPKKGKPGLDRAEFVRQLTGQQDGLNRLTVAEFIANRDHYIELSKENKRLKKKGGGRDPKGDAAQKVAREKALQDKTEELLLNDENLTRKEAREQADDWLSTQAALHDPDQVAGGHSHLITGMGDARVNYAIGGFWPSRIKGIDQQIRAHAATMSPEEQAATYLDVFLPLA